MDSAITVTLSDRAATEAWVRQFAAALKRPCVVLLSGPMGAGKTQLVRWFVQALGMNAAAVASPTFSVHQQYGDVDHVDLYRLISLADLESSGFWDLFSNPQGLVFVEWADRLPPDIWPRAWRRVQVQIEPMQAEQRRVTVTWMAGP